MADGEPLDSTMAWIGRTLAELGLLKGESMATETTRPKRKRGRDRTGRIYFDVRWNRTAGWYYRERGTAVLCWVSSRTAAIADAIQRAERVQNGGGLAEVVVYTQKGNIGKGPSARQTFGADPKRRRG